jgi:hypothetical protein
MSSPESDSTVKGLLSERETFQEISFDDGSLNSIMDVRTARVELFGLKTCDESGGLLEFSTWPY